MIDAIWKKGNLYFRSMFRLKSLLSLRFPIASSHFSACFYSNLLFLFSFPLKTRLSLNLCIKSLVSLHFPIEIFAFSSFMPFILTDSLLSLHFSISLFFSFEILVFSDLTIQGRPECCNESTWIRTFSHGLLQSEQNVCVREGASTCEKETYFAGCNKRNCVSELAFAVISMWPPVCSASPCTFGVLFGHPLHWRCAMEFFFMDIRKVYKIFVSLYFLVLCTQHCGLDLIPPLTLRT